MNEFYDPQNPMAVMVEAYNRARFDLDPELSYFAALAKRHGEKMTALDRELGLAGPVEPGDAPKPISPTEPPQDS